MASVYRDKRLQTIVADLGGAGQDAQPSYTHATESGRDRECGPSVLERLFGDVISSHFGALVRVRNKSLSEARPPQTKKTLCKRNARWEARFS